MIVRHTASGPLARVQELGRTAAARIGGKSGIRLAYIGWNGYGNLGDDAMAEAMELLLPDVRLMSYDGRQRERALGALGLSGAPYFRTCLLGGGTLISPSVFGALVDGALEQNLPLWAFGAGAGSSGFEQPGRVDLSAWAPRLARFARIGVRGYRSLATLRTLGITNAEVVGDPALALARPASPARGRKFALNLALPQDMPYHSAPHAALEGLEAAVASLVREGWEIVPIAMNEADIRPMREFLDKAGQTASISRPLTSEAFLESVSPCRFTIAIRLHAAVLSCCAGVPPLLLGYRDKCLDFMETMDLACRHVSLENAAARETETAILSLASDAQDLRGGGRKHGLAMAGHARRLRGRTAPLRLVDELRLCPP